VIREAEVEELSSDEEKRNKAKFLNLKLNNEELFKQTGLGTYLNGFPKEFAQARIIYGQLAKRTKGRIKSFVKRWFLLISAKSLVEYTKYLDPLSL
jgi:hypothetical protein